MKSSRRGKPSLRASAQGVEQALQIFQQRLLTRQSVAEALQVDRSVVGKFLRGEPVWSPKFKEISTFLGLSWQELIAEAMPVPATAAVNPEHPVKGVNSEVQSVRDRIRPYIRQRCQMMHLLGAVLPQHFQAVPTRLKIQDSSSTYAFIDSSLNSSLNSTPDSSAILATPSPAQPSLSGEEAVDKYQHLYVLGLPGSGKSTFLKYLATQCIEGLFKPNLVPLFVALRDISKALEHQSLIDCIAEIYGITCQLESETVLELFRSGSVLLLLDGEDEISEAVSKTLLLTNFDVFYQNHIVVSCRTAAHQHSYSQFTQATIQNFSGEQIRAFIDSWFQSNSQTIGQFLGWIDQIRQGPKADQALAEIPLLLALLCIVFQSSNFLPQGKAKLYEMALHGLLEDWNKSHVLDPSNHFSRQSYGEKLRILKAIAQATFENPGKCFSASDDRLQCAALIPTNLDQVSVQSFIHEIEVFCGLIIQEGWNNYRFSHLSFHEYLIALSLFEQIMALPGSDQAVNPVIQPDRLFRRDWYDVFLFLAEMLSKDQHWRFCEFIAQQLQIYLGDQDSVVQTQISAGGAIAQKIITYYQVTDASPAQARKILEQSPLEPRLVISAFCADYHYTFDPARRISRVLAVDYHFSHDLVLAHCFKCNLNGQTQQALQQGNTFDFGDALRQVWQNSSLHNRIQAAHSVDEVRALFFDYVLEHPQDFRQDVVDLFRATQQQLRQRGGLGGAIAIQAMSQQVGAVSQPDKEQNQFLESQQFQFPTTAYGEASAVAGLSNYYHGCTLLCHCIRTRNYFPQEKRQQLLENLFLTQNRN